MASPFLAPPQKLRGGAPTKRQVVGREASPHLEGGQVAVLRLHAAVSWPRNGRRILPSEGSVCALWHQNTPEHHGSAELRRTPLWRSSQNSPSTHSGE